MNIERHDHFPYDIPPLTGAQFAAHDKTHAHLGFFIFHFVGQSVVQIRWKLRTAVKRMQPHAMESIHQVLFALKPIAIDCSSNSRPHPRFQKTAFPNEDVVNGKFRHFLERSEVGEHKPAKFLYRITWMLNALFELTLGRFQGHIEYVTLGIVKPAVIAATNSPIFNASVLQRRASMAATEEKQSGVAAAVPKSNEIFTKNADALRQILQVLWDTNWLPVTA